MEELQKDLNNGNFNSICSNETTLKKYVSALLTEARKRWLEEEIQKMRDLYLSEQKNDDYHYRDT